METDNGQNEDVGYLQRQLDEIKKAQSGSDRRVHELQTENENLKKERDELLNTTATQEKKTEQTEKEKEFQRRMAAHEYATKKGVDPQEVFELFGLSGDLTDEERIDKYADILWQTQAEAKHQMITSKKESYPSGVKVEGGGYRTIYDYTEEQIRDMPQAKFEKLVRKAGGKPTTNRDKWGAK